MLVSIRLIRLLGKLFKPDRCVHLPQSDSVGWGYSPGVHGLDPSDGSPIAASCRPHTEVRMAGYWECVMCMSIEMLDLEATFSTIQG